VAFLVNDNTKWNCQSLYDAMGRDERFEPFIVVCKQPRSPLEESTRSGFEYDVEYFSSRGMPVIKAFNSKKNKHECIDNYKPDIVFYIQPWGYLKGRHDLLALGRKTLTCSIPYSLPVANDEHDINLTFHNLAWRVFLPTSVNHNEARIIMDNGAVNCRVGGYPKLDDYGSDRAGGKGLFKPSAERSLRLIYAPHHSIQGRLSYATFQWSGKAVLAYARAERSVSWVFKPHPRLKYELVAQGIMTLSEAESYYEAWDALPNTARYEQGGYMGLFEESDGLVTDCASFLGEYIPTGNPVFLLINPNSAGYNELGKAIAASYYHCHNETDLLRAIRGVTIERNDPLRELRLSRASQLRGNKPSSLRIMESLKQEIGLL
jgi:hypothetical protein